jgi:membrane-bound serine protease (ClpP class)
LTHPIITSLLLAVAMFGLIAEVRTPGWGLGGTLALVALALFFGSHLVVHLAEWQELVLFAAGLALLIIELIAIPGFGVVGLAGIAAMLASIVITQLGDFQLWSIQEIAAVVARLAVSMIGAFVLSFVVLRSLPRFAAFNRLVLSNEIKASEGYTSSSRDADDELMGKEGVTMSFLRPSGIAMFEGQRLNVITDGEFIEAQRPIKIVEARGSRVVVRAL